MRNGVQLCRERIEVGEVAAPSVEVRLCDPRRSGYWIVFRDDLQFADECAPSFHISAGCQYRHSTH
jgi:hypothetical protein